MSAYQGETPRLPNGVEVPFRTIQSDDVPALQAFHAWCPAPPFSYLSPHRFSLREGHQDLYVSHDRC
jgi:hypothetical protein